MKRMSFETLTPQPVRDDSGMWHWKDCQWMDGGIGFQKSGIEDHRPDLPDDAKVVLAKMNGAKVWCWAWMEPEEERTLVIVEGDYGEHRYTVRRETDEAVYVRQRTVFNEFLRFNKVERRMEQFLREEMWDVFISNSSLREARIESGGKTIETF